MQESDLEGSENTLTDAKGTSGLISTRILLFPQYNRYSVAHLSLIYSQKGSGRMGLTPKDLPLLFTFMSETKINMKKNT